MWGISLFVAFSGYIGEMIAAWMDDASGVYICMDCCLVVGFRCL